MEALTTIRLKNQFSELERIYQALVEFGKTNKIAPQILDSINLALEEIITNIISYAFTGNTERWIVVRLFLEGHQLTAEIEDDGKPFNPLNVPDPNIHLSLEDRPIGGLGIFLTKKMVDHLEYLQLDGKNLVRLKKNLPR
ncbi:MAG: ATP-binding protein [Nitrospirales bacterium]